MSDADAQVDVVSNFEEVKASVAAAAQAHGRAAVPRLVAVSKTKPLDMILKIHEQCGHRRFGENYVQELVDKAADPRCPEDIEWHFIGHLQRNKVKQLAAVQGLAMVETVSSQKLADALNKTFAEQERTVSVLIQVNTSREENKHGVLEDEVVAVAKHITASCPALRLCGLMTIGNLEQSLAPEETNPDFETLVRCRAAVASELGRDAEELELSMGMSSDYETAIRQGSTNVRVGSTIFGARHYAPK